VTPEIALDAAVHTVHQVFHLPINFFWYFHVQREAGVFFSCWASIAMKFGMTHKKLKAEEFELEPKGGWARFFMATLTGIAPLPRCLLVSLLVLQLVVLAIVKGLPVTVPWLTPCPPSVVVDVNEAIVVTKKAGLTKNASSEISVVAKHTSSEISVVAKNASCELGLVYVYSLPDVFNSGLIKNCSSLSIWGSFCPAVVNSGFGELITSPMLPAEQQGAWYKTDQFTGEIMFHTKMLEHPCVTDRPELASAFYVPFYAGLAVGKYLWSRYSAEDRDRHGKMVIDWLQGQEYWKRNWGRDHFLMMGRITWDFRRSRDEDWGSSFLYMPGMQNVTRLLIERNPWDEKEMGVPYPTAFHPRSEEDVANLQDYLRGVKRSKLFAFAGGSRKTIPNDFRGILLDQCRDYNGCNYLNCSGLRCSNDSMAAVHLFLDSTFCLQPRGDSFTRRSIFDCLIVGSIPVFFWHRSAYWQYKWHLPSDPSSYSVFISKHDVRNGTKVEEVLKAIPAEKVQRLRETVISSIPRFVYTAPGHRLEIMKDAVDIAVDGILNKIRSLGLNSQGGV